MSTIGRGSLEHPLTEAELLELCSLRLSSGPFDGKRVLVVIPDHTRHARIGTFFRIICSLLQPRVKQLDVLVATGTHAPMEMDRIDRHLGITAAERQTTYRGIGFYNHDHRDPSGLATIGTIPAREIAGLTGGVFSEDLPITINKRILECDHVILVSPVVPHETMGFAGGTKYFFPGVAGENVIETFHWLGAILTNPAVNGVKDTPTRRLIDRAARFVQTPSTCLAFAVNGNDEPMCLFVGDPVEAWSGAANYSAELHITYTDREYGTILAVTPDIYEELWVGGKAMYKLEPVLGDGGEVIIYGPQIKAISFVHDRDIRRVGYHVVEYFTKQWEKFSKESKLILAHSTNVRGVGTFDGAVEHPRVRVTLATSIPEEICRAVNLGYRDYRTLDPAAWRRKDDPGLLVVDNAGQNLYRLRKTKQAAMAHN